MEPEQSPYVLSSGIKTEKITSNPTTTEKCSKKLKLKEIKGVLLITSNAKTKRANGKKMCKTKKATKLVDSTADCGAIFTF